MHVRFSRFLALLTPVLAATLVASCDTGSPTGPRIVSLSYVAGNEQAAPVGATITDPLVVRAVDQNGVIVPGIPLVWEVLSGGGTLLSASTSTDATGVGQAVFRLGNSLGAQQVSVSVGQQQPIIFTLTATAAPASQLRVSSGNNQNGTVGAPLAVPLVAIATDVVSNPKAGVPVTFTVASGGGSVSVATVLTDANGLAPVVWTLGTASGAQTVVATSPGLPAVTFSANGQAATQNSIVIVSGNGQVASPGIALPQPIRIRVTDQFGNGVPGLPVTFTTTVDDGTVTPPSVLTGADGTAQAVWTLGPTGGLKRVTVAAGGLSVEFTAGSSVTYSNISMGGHHTCAVSTDHVLYCWGYNGEGQLGIGIDAAGSGPVFAYPQPSAATGSLTFRLTVNSLYHGCAITLAGAGYCWGVNHDGRLGTGVQTSVETQPVQTGLLGDASFAHSYRVMAVSRNHTCGITLADRLYCWGYGRDGQIGNGGVLDAVKVPSEVSNNLRWGQMSAGGLHTCAITLDGNTYCWGVNLRGELGDGSTDDRLVPTPIAGGPPFVRISAGGDHTCALSAAGAAWCWGDNTYGQLGNGSNAGSMVPVLVSGGLSFESISAGMHHTCGVIGTPPVAGADPVGGAVFCWGRNHRGQLGTGSQTTTTVPTASSGGFTFLSVSAGDLASCGITTGNRAYCWGDNQFGQLGDGTVVRRLVPTKVAFQP